MSVIDDLIRATGKQAAEIDKLKEYLEDAQTAYQILSARYEQALQDIADYRFEKALGASLSTEPRMFDIDGEEPPPGVNVVEDLGEHDSFVAYLIRQDEGGWAWGPRDGSDIAEEGDWRERASHAKSSQLREVR